jgi:hypothetical protein
MAARSVFGANLPVTVGLQLHRGSLVLGSPTGIRRQLMLDKQRHRAGRVELTSRQRSITANFIETYRRLPAHKWRGELR